MVHLVYIVAWIHCVGAELVEVTWAKSFKVICMKFHPVESEEVGRGLEGVSHSRI